MPLHRCYNECECTQRVVKYITEWKHSFNTCFFATMAHLSLQWETSGILLDAWGAISLAGKFQSAPGGASSKELRQHASYEYTHSTLVTPSGSKEKMGSRSVFQAAFKPQLSRLPRRKIRFCQGSLLSTMSSYSYPQSFLTPSRKHTEPTGPFHGDPLATESSA